ncbi:glycosyltransferase [Myxococcota bacterium]|nr:glycosyltransferase [Myxococcota bacterium]
MRTDERRIGSSAPADGVVCFAGVDWWYHNRGHSECQIMRRLAASHKVLWINSIGMRMPRPGATEIPLQRYARKLRSTLKGLRRDPSGMWIYSPLFVPRYTKRALAWNGYFLAAQVGMLRRWLGITRPSVWVTVPTAATTLAHGSWERVVFNRSDDFSAFPEVTSPQIAELEQELLIRADRVLYVNRGLYERERHGVRVADLIDHGVDFAHFAGARPVPGEAPEQMPPELRDLPRPIIGFYGALDDYTIDLELMIATARAFRHGTLLVIGPQAMVIDRLLAEPNVVYLGPIAYDRLPAFAAQFDIGIMPWLRNEWIEGCNPIKLKEYLALGFPIVTTRFPMLAPYEDLVYAAEDQPEFLAQLTRALATRDPAAAQARRERVADSSWAALSQQAAVWLALEEESGACVE